MVSESRTHWFPWRTLIILLLTGALVWWFLGSINPAEAWQAILGAKLAWLAAALAVTFQTYMIRSWRWQALLEPVGRVSLRAAFRATVMGFAGNLLLPARAGEFLRAFAISRREPVSVTAAFATIIVERLLDLATVLALFAAAILFSGIEISQGVKATGWVAAGGAAIGLAALFVLAGHPERFGLVADRLSRWLPARVSTAVGQLVRTLAEGFKVMRSPRHLLLAMSWSVALWVSIALGIIFTTWAFGLPITLLGSFLVVGYLTVGVAAPTPGATGGFHLAYKLAMIVLAPASEVSTIVAAAIVLHLVSFVPVTILGVIYMWQDGLTLGQVKAARSEAAVADGPL